MIVSYETRELLRQTLVTLSEHPPSPNAAELTVAVLDNGSRDGSADMVETDFPSVRLIRSQTNVGFAAANNLLAQTSDAAYVLLLNSDVIVVEDLVMPLIEALQHDPLAVVAGPRITFPDGSPQQSSQHLPDLRFEFARAIHQTKLEAVIRPLFNTEAIIAATRQHALSEMREPRRTPFLWATCWMAKRDDIQRYGLFDERYVTYDEDLDFCRRLGLRGRVALYVPAVHLVHLGGASSTSPLKTAMMRRGRARYFRQHHGPIAGVVYDHVIGAIEAVKPRRRVSRRGPNRLS